jgi:tetratricopeptide (TPR) repeat protein
MRARIRKGLLAALAVIALAGPAAAQGTEEADAFYQRGHALYDQGKLAEACAALARSQALSPSMATAALLAACDEKRGLLARAHAEYLDAARLAGSLFDKREAYFKERADTLAPSVPRLVIKIDPAAPPARVTRGGQEVDPDLLGTEIFVDPGTIEVVAAGPDGAEIRRSAVAAVGQRVEVVLPAFAVLKQSPARRAVRVVSYVTGGIGLAGALVGTGFALGAVARNNDSQACLPSAPTCPARNDALTAANVATVGFAVGLPALALGTVLFIVSRPTVAAPPKSAVSLSIAPGPRGVWITGTF